MLGFEAVSSASVRLAAEACFAATGGAWLNPSEAGRSLVDSAPVSPFFTELAPAAVASAPALPEVAEPEGWCSKEDSSCFDSNGSTDEPPVDGSGRSEADGGLKTTG